MNTVSVGMGASRKITENGQRSNKKYVVNILRKEGTMRTIILCILISVLSHWAWGQDSVLVSESTRKATVHEIHMSLWYQQFRPLLDAYKFYEAECWADSTKQTFHVYSSGRNEYTSLCPREYGETCIDPGISPRFRGHRTIYTHREPTFTGFMEFLKRKVKP